MQRDWRIPDQSSPLQQLIRNSSKSNVQFNTPSTQVNQNANSTNPTNVSKLKNVSEPTTIYKFISILLMYLCKKIAYFNLTVKVIIYMCSIVMVSMVTDYFPLPKSFFSDTTNYFNLYFVKYAWTITCGLNALFIYYTSLVYYCGDLWSVNRSLSRLAVGTVWWYMCSIVFEMIGYRYGVCVGGNQDNFNRDSCSGRWVSFSVSDRMFILLHSMLVTLEEIKSLPVWDRLNEVIIKNETDLLVSSKLSEAQIKRSKELYLLNVSTVRLLVMLMTLLILAIDFTLIISTIYFNNMPQKLAAALFALLGWLLTYKTLFKRKPKVISQIWFPRNPGDNLFIITR